MRTAGVQVARTQSLLDAAQVLVPGTFVVLVTWLAARFAVQGSISVGELVAFYGYAAFLVTPLRTITEAADKVTRAFVAARRMIALLSAASPLVADPAAPRAEPPPARRCTTRRPACPCGPGAADRRRQRRPRAGERPRRPARPLRRRARCASAAPCCATCPLDGRAPAGARRRPGPTLFSGRLRDELGGGDAVAAAARRLRRRRPRGAAGRARHPARGARPAAVGRAAAAAGARARARRRPGGARARRAHQRRRRAHRGAHRRAAARACAPAARRS